MLQSPLNLDIKPVPPVFTTKFHVIFTIVVAVSWSTLVCNPPCLTELHLLPGFVTSSRDLIGCGFHGELRPAGGFFLFLSRWLLPCKVEGERISSRQCFVYKLLALTFLQYHILMLARTWGAKSSADCYLHKQTFFAATLRWRQQLRVHEERR